MYQSFQLRRTKSKVTNRSYHNTSLRGCPVSPFTAIFIPPQHSALPPGTLAATGLAEAVLQGRERSALSGSVFVSFTFEGQFCQVRGSGVTVVFFQTSTVLATVLGPPKFLMEKLLVVLLRLPHRPPAACPSPLSRFSLSLVFSNLFVMCLVLGLRVFSPWSLLSFQMFIFLSFIKLSKFDHIQIISLSSYLSHHLRGCQSVRGAPGSCRPVCSPSVFVRSVLPTQ